MKNELLLKSVFEKVATTLINNVDTKYHDELLTEYKKYLNNCCSDYEFDELEFEVYANGLIELELSKWQDVNQNNKLSMLLKDEVLDKIQMLSYNGYRYAQEKVSSIFSNKNIQNIDGNIADKSIKELQELLPNVREFNRALATDLVSEGILDYEYASGNSNHTSLRIGILPNNIV